MRGHNLACSIDGVNHVKKLGVSKFQSARAGPIVRKVKHFDLDWPRLELLGHTVASHSAFHRPSPRSTEESTSYRRVHSAH
ncbi:hypothetical protein POX_a00359 [Penicillium oxalicum]|uniref:hypothetical protein n=1 Tax=Penicillium oxalicum TaxID=69781 RepID=UPI0020B7367A|nr:hypothetical protein POX_a00359 [Penicillium oxalicum]KAI2793774.1 hypothetical protein POX_a00359 [Penicillium oxalicum]